MFAVQSQTPFELYFTTKRNSNSGKSHPPIVWSVLSSPEAVPSAKISPVGDTTTSLIIKSESSVPDCCIQSNAIAPSGIAERLIGGSGFWLLLCQG